MKNHFRVAIRHITRTPYQAFAAIGTSTLTFFLAAIFGIIGIGSATVLNYFETRPQISAFFKDETSTQQIESVQKKLMDTNLASEVKYISKEEALNIYREQNKNDPLLLEMVTASILPASLEISAKDTPSLKELAKLVQSEPGVEEVIFQEDIVDSLVKWTNTIRLIGIVLVSAFGLLTLVIIVVIIGMKIALKKDEIEILHLIGATRSYIQAPFLLEGIFYATIGGLLAWILAIIVLLYSTPFMVNFLAGMPIFPIPLWFYPAVLGVELGSGLVLGILGSLLAVKRYLK